MSISNKIHPDAFKAGSHNPVDVADFDGLKERLNDSASRPGVKVQINRSFTNLKKVMSYGFTKTKSGSIYTFTKISNATHIIFKNNRITRTLNISEGSYVVTAPLSAIIYIGAAALAYSFATACMVYNTGIVFSSAIYNYSAANIAGGAVGFVSGLALFARDGVSASEKNHQEEVRNLGDRLEFAENNADNFETLRVEFTTVQKELAAAKEELVSTRAQLAALVKKTVKKSKKKKKAKTSSPSSSRSASPTSPKSPIASGSKVATAMIASTQSSSSSSSSSSSVGGGRGSEPAPTVNNASRRDLDAMMMNTCRW